MKKVILLFLTTLSCWTLSAQTVASSEEIQDAPKKYLSPTFYAVTSVVPGLGQFLLGEPVRGVAYVLASAGCVAAVGCSAYASIYFDERRIEEYGTGAPLQPKDIAERLLFATLFYGGQIGWVLIEICSVTDAYVTARDKRGEFGIRPTVTYNPGAGGEVSYAPGVSLALRF
jgi:hypothetical protein